MTAETKWMSGIILLSIVTIEFGGFFLLGILSGKQEGLALTAFQKAMFRAGHAHAGVLVLLALICQILADHAQLSPLAGWISRTGVAAAALLVSGGFFGAASGRGTEKPNRLIALIYAGMFLLALSLVVLGIGLLRAA